MDDYEYELLLRSMVTAVLVGQKLASRPSSAPAPNIDEIVSGSAAVTQQILSHTGMIMKLKPRPAVRRLSGS